MILVTLGSQDKPFGRLLEKIEEQIKCGNIKDEVIVQAGFTKFSDKYMKILGLVDREEFQRLISECDLLITHGGVGSILTGLSKNKKVIACPRLAKYGEVLNDHQIQIVDNFAKEGYILSCHDDDDLGAVLGKLAKFKPKKIKSNTNKFVSIIEDFIDKN